MFETYLKLIENDIRKYYKNFFEFDYETIIKICINRYKEFNNEKNISFCDRIDMRNCIFSFILNLSNKLDKYSFKDFIKIIKKYKFNKIFSEIIDYDNNNNKLLIKLKKTYKMFFRTNYYEIKFPILLRFFPKTYFKIHLIKNGYLCFTNKRVTRKKLEYFLNDKFSNNLKKIFCNFFSLPYIELVITTKCNLKCANCANLMYKYSNPYNVDLDNIKFSIRKLLSCTDEIKTFRILGGEPFLNNDLKEILKELNSKKIKNIVIVTNGTIIPKDKDLLKELKKDNISIEISDYNYLSNNKDKLIKFMQSQNIKIYCVQYIHYWFDYGNLKKYANNIKQQFDRCDCACKSLLNGKIYYCPRQAHGTDLKIIETKNSEYIDLLNNSDKQNKKLLKRYLFRNEPINACNYCKYATKDCKIIDVAKQIRKV